MARRNANGEGTIYQRKDGRWEAAVYVLTTSGMKKRVRVYGATRAEVSRKLTEAKAKNDQGIPAADKTWLLGDYLDYWLAEVIKPNRRATTYDLYESNVRLHLKPALGHVSLTSLSVPMLQRYLNQQLEGGHSLRKVQTLREIVSSALTRAMRDELLTRNVARLVEVKGRQGNDVQPWTLAEMQKFLEVARPHKWYAAFLISTLYGLRRGEVIGLRWEDIDFVNRKIYVRQQVFRAGGEVQIGPLKTKSAKRDLPLLDVVAEALKEHHEHRAVSSKAGLVFTTSTGRPIEPYNYTRAFKLMCRRNGLRSIRLHDLRHGAATTLKWLGVPDRDIQLILGHSHVSITQQIYQHDTMESRRDALSRMQDALLDHDDASLDGNDDPRCRQISRQSPSTVLANVREKSANKKLPRLLGSFSWLGWRDSNPRMPGPKLDAMGQSSSAASRITEVDAALRTHRRRLMLGVVAVSAAVKNTRENEMTLAT
ncbi:tyrosine-type recombinase/integrase [Streptomyces cynarae]|uniref:tyrosine-type recombinase/integrase n=1 Tax=Streptomyces cynarae TaxID=2981134 RepID=UPI00406C9C86